MIRKKFHDAHKKKSAHGFVIVLHDRDMNDQIAHEDNDYEGDEITPNKNVVLGLAQDDDNRICALT